MPRNGCSDIGVQVLNDVAAVPVACDSHVITTWRQREERARLEPLEQGTQDGGGSPLLLNFENRSPEEYRRQVASYLTKMASVFPSIARAGALLDRDPSMQLVVINETEHNFTGVRVEVTIEGDVWAYRSAEDAQPEMPTPPREWRSGPWITMPSIQSMPTVDIWGPHIDNSGSSSIEFPDVDIRPRERVTLDPIHLVCDVKLAGAMLTTKWTATSSSASGVARGDFPIKVSSEIFSLTIE